MPDDLVLLRDLRYREGPSRHWTLDLAMPKEKSAESRPAIVVIHGGGWIEGDKSSFSTVARRPPGNIIDFARLGFVAATINYRLSGEAPYPAAFHDCQCAVRWLRANSQKYNLDPERIGAWGNSAGGHLALLLGLVESESVETDAPYGEQSSRVQAVVSDSGPIDLAYQHRQGTLRTVVEKFTGGAPDGPTDEVYKSASPSTYVSAKAPPVMLIYGEADEQVPIETADEFVVALHRAGLKDLSYHRLGRVGHCPHSLIRVNWLVPAVNEFFQRTLSRR